jgi:hypothetical protein
MNMSEIESIETRVPIGMRLELNQLERDSLVLQAKRERSLYIAASFRKLFGMFKSFAAQARGDAGYKADTRLPHGAPQS